MRSTGSNSEMYSSPFNAPRVAGLKTRLLSGFGFAALLLTTSCGGEAGNSVANNSVNVNSQAAPAVEPGANVSDTASASGLLSKYVGKHPSDAVAGTRFLDEPTVRAAVEQTVEDPKVRNFVFNYDGPDAPIVAKNGRILAWGCKQHNCGYQNWSVSITPDGSTAEVCFYHDDDSADGPATWYLPGGKTEKRPGNCPSD